MPVIRVDEKIYRALQGLVEEPFKETPNSVIERLLEEKGVLKSEKGATSKEENGEANMEYVKDLENLPSGFDSQRKAMITLYREFKGDKEKTINAYAYLEKNGSVSRKKNTYDLKPLSYSKALFSDGIKRGWLG